MKKEIGLWIDHRSAVIVIIQDGQEEIKEIKSNMEKKVRFKDDFAFGEDLRDRQFQNHLNSYYDEVIEYMRDAERILILGPGEAKGELEKRIEHHGIKAKVQVEAADKMTENQISAKVREHFLV
jgi:stalled ribosome rescue protein Dom34